MRAIERIETAGRGLKFAACEIRRRDALRGLGRWRSGLLRFRWSGTLEAHEAS